MPIVLVILIMLTISFSLQGKKVTVNISTCYDDVLFKKFILDAFHKSHPEIEIKNVFSPSNDVQLEKIMTGLVGGKTPEMASLDCCFAMQMVKTGQILASEDFIKRPGGPELSDWVEATWEFSRYNGKVWAFPMDCNDIGMYYNKDAFEKKGIAQLPQTWDELVATAQKLNDTDKGVFGLGIPFFDPWWEICSWDWQCFLYQNGGEFLNKDLTQALFNSNEGIEALQFWVDLVHKWNVTPLQLPEQAFVRQKVSMVVDGSWMSSDQSWGYKQPIGDSFKWGTFPFPKKKVGATNLGGWQSVIFKSDAEREEAAWEFLQWVFQPENHVTWAYFTNDIPTTKTAIETKTYKEHLANNPQWQAFVESLSFARTRPPVKSYYEISKNMASAIQKALYQEMTPKEALDAAAQLTNELLSKE